MASGIPGDSPGQWEGVGGFQAAIGLKWQRAGDRKSMGKAWEGRPVAVSLEEGGCGEGVWAGRPGHGGRSAVRP